MLSAGPANQRCRRYRCCLLSGRGRLLTATSVSRDGYSLWSGSWFLIAVSRSKRHENHARQTHQEADSNKACHYYARSCILFSSAFTANMDGRKRGEFNSASVYCISNNKQNTVVSRREKAHFIKGQQSYSKRHQEHSNIGAYGIPRIMLILPGKQHPKPCYHATNRGNHHYNKAYSRNITDHVLPFFLYAFRKRSFNT